MKLIASSPAIKPLLEELEDWNFEPSAEYNTATAYLAISPPSEWAKKDIFFRLFVLFTTSVTWLFGELGFGAIYKFYLK